MLRVLSIMTFFSRRAYFNQINVCRNPSSSQGCSEKEMCGKLGTKQLVSLHNAPAYLPSTGSATLPRLVIARLFPVPATKKRS